MPDETRTRPETETGAIAKLALSNFPDVASLISASPEALIDIFPDAVIAHDGEHIFYCNTTAVRMFRAGQATDLIGRSPDILVASSEIPNIRAMRQDLRGQHERLPFHRRRFARFDGRNFEGAGSAIPFAVGSQTAFLVIIRDIREQVLAEKALFDSEERFRTSFEYAQIGMALLGIDRRIQAANDSFCSLLGYSEEELLSLTSDDITDPSDHHLSEQGWQALLVQGEASFHCEKRFVRKDGTIVWGALNSSLVRDSEGQPLHVVSQVEDITERARVHQELESRVRERTQKLEESEQRFRDFADSAADRLWETDTQHRYSYLSEQSASHHAMPTELIFGKQRWRLPGVEQDPSFWLEHQKDLDAHRPFKNFAYSIFDRDGRKHHVKASGRPLFDQAGVFRGYRGTVVDETAEVEAREEVADIRGRYLTALENISEDIGLWDADGRFVYCNGFFRELHADVRATLEPGVSYENFLWAMAKQNFASRDVLSEREWVNLRLDGFRNPGGTLVDQLNGRWIQVRKEQVDDGSTVILVSDITDRKDAEEAFRESEERFRRSFEDASIGMAVVDLAGRFRVVNRALCEMLGYSEAELTSHTELELTHPDDCAETQQVRHDAIVRGVRPRPQQKRYIHKSGKIVWVSTARAVIRNPEGRALYTVGQIQDMTEYVEAEERLRQAQKMEVVGQLTGGIAHDFNNLLSAILGNLELASNRLTDEPEVTRRIGRAIQSAKSGGELTNRLLAFSRRQMLEPRVTDVCQLVTEMLEIMKHTLGETITIATEFAGDLSPITVDANQLENAILNLAINARDAMPHGGTLTLRSRNCALSKGYSRHFGEIHQGDYIVISVTDTGSGMVPEVLERIFEPFFTTKESGHGSGLGLSMVFGFIKQSEGHVDIKSAPGAGTNVSIYLPVASDQYAIIESDRDTRHIQAGDGERILLVEDDEAVREATAGMLEHLGYDVVDGGDGHEALNQLAATPSISLMLTDMVLPHGNSGPSLATAAQLQSPNLKILMMTGYADRAMPSGGEGPRVPYRRLSKPFAIDDLSDALRDLIDG